MIHTFKMSGGLGDIIYALPAMRELGGGTLAICPSNFTEGALHSGDGGIVSARAFRGLDELITKGTDYVERVDIFEEEVQAKYDLNEFRACPSLQGPPTLAEMILRTFECNPKAWLRQWLDFHKAPGSGMVDVVIHRSARYHCPAFPWRIINERYKGKSMFIGRRAEHDAFAAAYGWLPYYSTESIYDFAVAIAECSIFCGNQSVGYAIAEGLKQPAILEEYAEAPNCNFERKTVLINPQQDDPFLL